MSDPIITRFAPSPTGFLHIGGARTALFNWLYAKANNGKMLLRIEDTDRKRSDEAATQAIYDGLKWLGLDWDGEPISQFARAARHREVAMELLKHGHAYKCYASPEELEAMRTTARETGKPIQYAWRNRSAEHAPKDVDPVIRLKAPKEGETIIEDKVQGRVVFPNKDLDDLVLLRSDQTPTYMLAVVVDDHDMGVTDIIRGDDHLTNAARQALIYHAMEWEVPKMAHIPLIHGPDGAKLSKRHGALGVEAYRAMGYLPEALRNYLVRLGWSHGDDEIISTKQMIEWFDSDGIGKGASRFDFAKLEHINGHYIRHSDDASLLTELLNAAPYLEKAEHLTTSLEEDQHNLLLSALPILKEKTKNLNELAGSTKFLWNTRPVKMDEKAAKFLDADARSNLARLIPVLEQVTDWNSDSLSEKIREFCAENELKLGKVAQPIRCAIAGTPSAPGVFEIMELFGKSEVLARLGDQSA